MASDPNIDTFKSLPDEGEVSARGFESVGAARYLGEVVLGGVKAVFSWNPAREFEAANDNRARTLERIMRAVPDVRPDTPAESEFTPEKITDVPPPVPQSGLTRFADKDFPAFDLRPAGEDPLGLDPLGLDTPLAANDNIPPRAANDNGTLPAITKIRA